MRPLGRPSLALVALGLLAVGSIGLKAFVGPPRDVASRSGIDQELARRLRSQGFVTTARPAGFQSGVVAATRGSCHLTVRDALDGTAGHVVFTRDAAGIGPIRYLFDGRSYTAPPAFRFRLARVQTEFANRLGLSAHLPIPLAVATSPACNGDNFGLENVRAET